jgi:hypothetical protein
MAGDDIRQGSTPMISDAMAHDPVVPTPRASTRALPDVAGVPAGRRISFAAWGVALAVSIAMWALFFKLI